MRRGKERDWVNLVSPLRFGGGLAAGCWVVLWLFVRWWRLMEVRGRWRLGEENRKRGGVVLHP
ncbi:hypothetical protein HAX54_038016, partial [Datura stramonium]|nr:hypothetical protein [Datura stramonium]